MHGLARILAGCADAIRPAALRCEPHAGVGSTWIYGRKHGQPCRLLPAALAFEARGELLEPLAAVDPSDLNPAQGRRGAAGGALDLQGAAEADEIAGRADMLVGHSCCLCAAEHKGNKPGTKAVEDLDGRAASANLHECSQ